VRLRSKPNQPDAELASPVSRNRLSALRPICPSCQASVLTPTFHQHDVKLSASRVNLVPFGLTLPMNRNFENHLSRWHTVCVAALLSITWIVWTTRSWLARPGDTQAVALESAFQTQIKPFLGQYCVQCHNADVMTSGVRVDHLDSTLQDRHLRLWEAVRKK